MKHSLVAFALMLSAGFASAQDDAKPAPAAVKFFESKVRPILAENCFSCHGEKRQRGSLRLDSRATILEGGDVGPAIVPGHPEKSLLVKAIGYTDPHFKMPPTKKLSREQIADLTNWIKMGAPWPGAAATAKVAPRKGADKEITDADRAHWAFQPIKRPPIPPLNPPLRKGGKPTPPPLAKGGTEGGWAKNPIDAFIAARLEAKGLAPNEPATPQQLVRRAYYDVTGLPPTPKDVADFEKAYAGDPQKAWENLVDRLLDSPHYGEKWARHWLDLVRYAETNSYERDNPKPHVWRYRDYVIRALSQDKPFDQFLREQLAGDELGTDDPAALIATGYYRLGIWDDEPSDPLQSRYDGLDDIVATTSQVFLGLTLDCARCHEHKIDPLQHRDYYRFLAFFHNINHFRNGGPTDERPILTPEARVAYEARLKERTEQLDGLQAKITAVEKEFRKRIEERDKTNLVGNDLDDLRYRFYRSAWNKLPDFAEFKHEDEGRLANNLFDISVRTRDEAIGFVFEGTLIVPEAGTYTFFLDSDDGSRLTLAGQTLITYDGIHGMGKEQQKTVELPKGRLPITLEYFQNQFGFGLSVAWAGPGFTRRLLSAPDISERTESADFRKIIASEGPKALGKQRYAEYQRLRKNLDELKKAKVAVDMALCVTEQGTRAPETFVFIRGNPNVQGDRVQPAFPTVFNVPEPKLPAPEPGAKSSGRRKVLADWLSSPDNPLTARVMANRIWQHHFGRGIVRTPNDFGVQGTKPTHPELLDWLASEFIAKGWSMKALHRLILTSNVYKMSSHGQEAGLKIDPDNDLFWRFDMRRLSGEEIRDSILAVSGNLNLKMHGPSIYPPIPQEVLEGQSQPGRGWNKSPPEEAARRSVYIHVKRSLLFPILVSFDLAEPDKTTPVRFTTTQPTQALGMLNGEFLNEQAGIFAKRLQKEAPGGVREQVRLALALAMQRPPRDAEVQRGLRLIESLQREERLSADAALKAYCLLVLNLNEFVYLD